MSEKQNNNTRIVAQRLVEEIYFLKATANPINQRIKELENFLNTLYDKMLEAGMKDYDIEHLLDRNEEVKE